MIKAAIHFGCALLASTALASPAFAQAKGAGTIFDNVDGNGVDLTTGVFNLSVPAGSVGNGEGALSFVEYFSGSTGYNLQTYFYRSESGTQVTISLTFGDRQETFTGAKSATTFTSDQGTGATLTKISAEEYSYVAADGSSTAYRWPAGTVYQGGNAAYCTVGTEAVCDLLADSTHLPSHMLITYNWRTGENCRPRTLPDGEIVYDCTQYYRLESVAKSSGYMITL